MLKLALALLLAIPAAWAQTTASSSPEELRKEIEKLKQAVNALEQRLAAQDKEKAQAPAPAPAPSEVAAQLKELDQRVSLTERSQSLDRVKITGDYRFEAHTIRGSVPAHYDGL